MLSNSSSHNKLKRSLSNGKQKHCNKTQKNKSMVHHARDGKQNNHLYSQKSTTPSQHKKIPQKSNQTTMISTNTHKAETFQNCQLDPNAHNLDNASLTDMVELLRQYEKQCLSKQDFSSAEEAKNKIEFLRTQQLIIRKEELETQDKQNVERISKEGEQEIKMFQEHWDEQLQELIQALKEVEHNLTEQHQTELFQIHDKLQEQQPPRIKYSSQVLELRRHLTNLIKVKNYKQAQIIKNKLEDKEKDETEKWGEKFETKKRYRIEAVIKKQEAELKALRIRLEGVFNQKLKERDQKFQILLKKNRKRRIESGKISRERLKTKTAIMNQSKSIMQSTIGAIGTGTYKY